MLCALLAILGGCGSSGPPTPERFFSLEPEVAVEPSAQTLPGTLLVTPLAARGFVGGSQIVFQTAAAPLQVQRYDDLLWEETPGRAISAALIAALRAARVFEFTVSIADRARPDFMLNGQINQLEHLPTASPPQVRAAFNLALIANSNRETRFSKTYSGTEPTAASTPEEMIRAFNRLTGRLLTQALADLQAQAPGLARRATSSD
jgi:cholesterol transport system auxiliary component